MDNFNAKNVRVNALNVVEQQQIAFHVTKMKPVFTKNYK
jgi:hypothetical protein